MQDEVVIVDPKGNEHIFPAGFDPAKAAAIVRGQLGLNGADTIEHPSGPVSPLLYLHEQEGKKPPVQHEPDTYWGGFRKGLNDYATEVGQGMFKSAVAPEKVADFLSLMLPTRPSMPGVTGMDPFAEEPILNRAAKATGRGVASTLENGPVLKVGGVKVSAPITETIAEKLRSVSQPRPRLLRPEEWAPEGNPEAWREFAGSRGPGPEPFHPLDIQEGNPEAWRAEAGSHGPGDEPFHPVEGGEGTPEAWRNEPRSGGPLTVEPTSQTDRVPAGNPGAVPAPSPRSAWPPEGAQGDWHSGAESGSPEAARAQGLHRDTGELDARYRTMTQDTRDALLAELMRTLKP